MSSRVEEIMLKLLDQLIGPPMNTIPETSVFRNFYSALNSELPAVFIEEGDEPTPDLSHLGRADRHLNVRVSVLIKGEQSYQFADEPLVEVYDRIMQDRTVSGLALDLTEGETKRERAMLEKPVAIISKHFLVRYRTDETSLS